MGWNELGAWRPHQPSRPALNSSTSIRKSANIHPSGPESPRIASPVAAGNTPSRSLPSLLSPHPQIHHPRTDRIRNLLGPDPLLCPSDFPWLEAQPSTAAGWKSCRRLFSLDFFSFSILIFHLSTWPVDAHLTRLPPRSIVVHARHGSGLLACRLTDG